MLRSPCLTKYPGKLKHSFLLALCCLALLCGCATREDAGLRVQPRLPHMRDAEDVRRLPQDLTVYAQRAGNGRLLSEQEQARQDARFDRIFFSPWTLSRPSVTARAFAARFGNGPRGFTEDARPWTREEWSALRANADLAGYPGTSQAVITIRHSILRELPTLRARMAEPRPFGQDNPFDMFQYSSLFHGTPLYAVHTSADGLWRFVESPIAAGWVPADDLATVDAAFIARYRSGRYVAALQDELPLRTEEGSIGSTHIGAVYPLHEESARGIRALAPVRGARGEAVITTVSFGPDQAGVKPLPLHSAWLARLGNRMLGQPYGWGGLFTWRDCSSTMRDLFAPFGIWLPRNSAAQGRSGSVIPLAGMDGADKEALIARSGVPFMSLLRLPGHIMLYLGQYRGESVVFHNIWGLRVVTAEDADARHVLGRAVVSGLRLGRELPALKEGTTLLDRLAGMTTLGERE